MALPFLASWSTKSKGCWRSEAFSLRSPAELFSTVAEAQGSGQSLALGIDEPQAPCGPPGAHAPGGSSRSSYVTTHSHCTWTSEGGHVSECLQIMGVVQVAEDAEHLHQYLMPLRLARSGALAAIGMASRTNQTGTLLLRAALALESPRKQACCGVM